MLNGSRFSTGRMGYATLEIYDDGSSRVRYYGVDESGEEEFLFTSAVLPPEVKKVDTVYSKIPEKEVMASVYTKEEIDRSGFFKAIRGERYRKYYGREVTAPVVYIDTLFGGLKPVKKGGGHQSKSLRLRHDSGKEYVMRALRKLPELYLQSMAFQEQYVMDDLKDTYAQELLEDFYTGFHPYAPFTIGKLSDAVGILHTNPVLYYIPKQDGLGEYNDVFGDELYMIEEHAGDGHGDLKSFGYSNELKSTDSMLEDLRDDEKYEVDTEAYIRARLFDMVIGDWDRHVHQWRWAEFKEDGKVVYRPVPRDRDQAYSQMGDGIFMGLATRIIPGLRLMEGFNEEIRNVKGFNSSPKTYVLDLALLSESTLDDWRQQAKFLRDNLDENAINEAFKMFPEEVQDGGIQEIKRVLLSRVQNVESTAIQYFNVLNKFATVVGTDKDDWFVINRLDNRRTQVKAYRIIDGEKKKQFFDKIFNASSTHEIWIYGLDDDDVFEMDNFNNYSGIKVRIIGGQNNDIYRIKNGRGVAIYDYKSKDNTFEEVTKTRVRLTDDYPVNTYNPLNIRSSNNQVLPTVGFNPDDGIKVGFLDTYTYNGFRQNPFTQQHTFKASYYFATSGVELHYNGEFANIFEHWNLALKTRFTTPNFAINFFGFGNNTENLDDDLGMDYNRVRIQNFEFAPSLIWRSPLGAKFGLGISYESIEVEETSDRFINSFYQQNGQETGNSFLGVHGSYSYENHDNQSFPTMGMATSIALGFKDNVGLEGKNFGYLIPSISFDYKLIPNGRLVLATKWKGHLNMGNGYEFYQAASIGGTDGLRGYRNQRFTGKASYYQNTDVRYSLRKMRTRILPTARDFLADLTMEGYGLQG
ncbi:hypothetical protein [Maribacter litopenaei]|uniref:hypothetical protein n=1 Tax=Maribacter litopenaei TaxID=2976127 RepID=UPI0030841C89